MQIKNMIFASSSKDIASNQVEMDATIGLQSISKAQSICYGLAFRVKSFASHFVLLSAIDSSLPTYLAINSVMVF